MQPYIWKLYRPNKLQVLRGVVCHSDCYNCSNVVDLAFWSSYIWCTINESYVCYATAAAAAIIIAAAFAPLFEMESYIFESSYTCIYFKLGWKCKWSNSYNLYKIIWIRWFCCAMFKNLSRHLLENCSENEPELHLNKRNLTLPLCASCQRLQSSLAHGSACQGISVPTSDEIERL